MSGLLQTVFFGRHHLESLLNVVEVELVCRHLRRVQVALFEQVQLLPSPSNRERFEGFRGMALSVKCWR